MRASVKSAMLRGVACVPVTVEVVAESGLPSCHVVGMADAGVFEAKERVRCAIRAAGFSWPQGRVLVNLAPSTLHKRGSQFDLAMAAGVLAATGQIDPAVLDGALVFGELMLDGAVVPNQRGFAAYVRLAEENGWGVMCASGQTATDSVAHRVPYRPVDSLADLGGAADDARAFDLVEPARCGLDGGGFEPSGLDDAIREAVGSRSSLLVFTRNGDDIARRARYWTHQADALDGGEECECEAIASCAGVELPPVTRRGTCRPFRAPHHSVTLAGLIGGGRPVYPGEVTLAHNGTLFLDGAEHFTLSQLDALGAVRREGGARIVRADGVCEMPATFALIATAKPCPCGNYGSPKAECTCSVHTFLSYRKRLEGAGHGLFDSVVS